MTALSTKDAEIPARQSRRGSSEEPPNNIWEFVWKLVNNKTGTAGALIALFAIIAWWLGTTVIVPVMESKAASDRETAKSMMSVEHTAASVARSSEQTAIALKTIEESLRLVREIINDTLKHRELK